MSTRKGSHDDAKLRGFSDSLLLNVDLELESADDLAPLVLALEPAAHSLDRPRGRACFELNSAVSPTDAESVIVEFVGLISSLPPSARIVWDRASRRVFDMGFQAAVQPFQQTHCLKPSTLRAVADLGAEVAVTIYAPELLDEDEASAR